MFRLAPPAATQPPEPPAELPFHVVVRAVKALELLPDESIRQQAVRAPANGQRVAAAANNNGHNDDDDDEESDTPPPPSGEHDSVFFGKPPKLDDDDDDDEESDTPPPPSGDRDSVFFRKPPPGRN